MGDHSLVHATLWLDTHRRVQTRLETGAAQPTDFLTGAFSCRQSPVSSPPFPKPTSPCGSHRLGEEEECVCVCAGKTLICKRLVSGQEDATNTRGPEVRGIRAPAVLSTLKIHPLSSHHDQPGTSRKPSREGHRPLHPTPQKPMPEIHCSCTWRFHSELPVLRKTTAGHQA